MSLPCRCGSVASRCVLRERCRSRTPRGRYARPMGRAFAVRGIVEGFYGTPWSHAARLDAISLPRAARPERVRVRAEGRREAPGRVARPVRRRRARALRRARRARRATTARGSASRSRPVSTSTTSRPPTAPRCSPSSQPLLDAGVPWFLLLLDDIPMQAGLAPRQAELATWLFDQLRAARADAVAHALPDRVRRDAAVAVPRRARRGPPARRRRDVDRADRVLADACAPTTRAAGPRRSAGTARSCGTTRR